jgi:two-component system response regulator
MAEKFILLVEDDADDEALTLRALRQARTALIPVVVLTSSSEDEDMLKSYRFGANSYVRKPVEFGAFASAVSQLGLYRMLLNESARR